MTIPCRARLDHCSACPLNTHTCSMSSVKLPAGRVPSVMRLLNSIVEFCLVYGRGESVCLCWGELLICSYWSTTCKITCQPYSQDNAHSTPTVLVTFQFKTSGRWPCVVPWRASCAAHLEKECMCVRIVTFSPTHSKFRPSRISLESWNADSAPLLVFACGGGCDPLT